MERYAGQGTWKKGGGPREQEITAPCVYMMVLDKESSAHVCMCVQQCILCVAAQLSLHPSFES